MEEQYYSAALVMCGAGAGISGISGFNTVSLYTTVVSEIYSRNISLFSCNGFNFP